MKLNILIPTYNEEAVLEETVCNWIPYLKPGHEIIIVDDGSLDNTALIIKKLCATHPCVTAKLNSEHKGYAAVVKQGFSLVNKDELIVTVMADGCDDPRIIEPMYQQILAGSDIVCGSRYTQGGKRIGGSFCKFLGSKYMNLFFLWTKKSCCSDTTNSFKMFRRNILDNICLQSSGFEIFAELVVKSYRAKYRISEIPTVWKSRVKGKSKFNMLKDGLKYCSLLNR